VLDAIAMMAAVCRVHVSDHLAYPGPAVARDRAAVVTTALLQILRTAPPQHWRPAFENYLRDEFADIARAQNGNDI
jgi:hypothetical protein